jgi:CYTH domain-containing protein/thymidylate kinase
VLTGGPCAGKTTALSKLRNKFMDIGFHVYILPETATLFNQAGVEIANIEHSRLIEIEINILLFQIEMETRFEAMARNSPLPVIIICDRGVLDVKAYLKEEDWQAIIKTVGITETTLRDSRYAAVFHLVTAAKGAEAHYSLENNQSRTEGLEKTREIDEKLLEAWIGHPHLRVFDNTSDFDHKMDRVIQEMSNLLGLPEPVEIERKFLVEIDMGFPVFYSKSEIEQTYLIAGEQEERRVRKRGMNGNFCYSMTKKKSNNSGEGRIETERSITADEYSDLLKEKDTDRRTIKKIRRCFVWDSQYFELDRFIQPDLPYLIMEIEGKLKDDTINFPPFIKVIKEVTDDPQYYNHQLSKK